MDKPQALESLKQKITRDKSLPNRDTAHNLVFGEGNPNPKVLFLGEAPGKNEDLSGKPFFGAAGKILDELLNCINLSRDDVFITSILMYRPPKNRDPKPSEIKLFEPYIDELIKLLDPPIIATLGRHSLEKFIPTPKISTIHGQLQAIHWHNQTVKILPLYHPAAVLYNPKLKEILIKDFKNISELIR